RTQAEVDTHADQTGKGIGRIRYKDLNGDGQITWEQDRTWLGNSDPDLMYGINFDAKYRSFDFSMFWQGLKGVTIKNDWKTYSDFYNVLTTAGFNHSTRILNAFNPYTNPNSNIPAMSHSNANDENRLSTYFLESGSYFKLRHIEFGYNLPINTAD